MALDVSVRVIGQRVQRAAAQRRETRVGGAALALEAGPPGETSVMRTPTRQEVDRNVTPSGSCCMRTLCDGMAPATSSETTPAAAAMALDMATVSL